MIWETGKVESVVAQYSNMFRTVDVEKLVNAALDRVREQGWVPRIRHA
jgi:hypothetical protein